MNIIAQPFNYKFLSKTLHKACIHILRLMRSQRIFEQQKIPSDILHFKHSEIK